MPGPATEQPQNAAAAAGHDEQLPQAALLSGAKRKEPELKKKASFKGVATLVMAMKRFSNSINPTYSYGKRTTSTSSGGKEVSEDKEAHGAVNSARPTSPGAEHDKYAYNDRGHRFDFLLKPLPPTEEEEEAVAAPVAKR